VLLVLIKLSFTPRSPAWRLIIAAWLLAPSLIALLYGVGLPHQGRKVESQLKTMFL
jgi:hypothetical protein